MHSYLISELARLHGEDLRRDAEHHRRRRERPRRRPTAVVAWLRSVLSHRSGMPTALPVLPTVLSYPRSGVPVIPRQAGPRVEVAPLLDVVEGAASRRVVEASPREMVVVPAPRKVVDLVNLGDLPGLADLTRLTDVADAADVTESRCEC